MKSHKEFTNDEVEGFVLQAVRNGALRAGTIVRIVFRNGGSYEATHRRVDRALQRLRKAGKVTFGGSPRAWRIAGGA